MDLGPQDRVVAVTGGTRGIGRAVVDALVAEGARVAVCARGTAGLDELARAHDPDRVMLAAYTTGTAVDVSGGLGARP